MMWDLLLTGCHLATMRANGEPFGAVRDAALAIAEGRIAFAGPARLLGTDLETRTRTIKNVGGRWVTPGLIDCHTHLVFGGNRAREWEARLRGETYESIAAKGGGILSTVMATRAESEERLAETGSQRLAAMAREGVTTVEIKSGYGLNLRSETRMLAAASHAGERANVRVVRTFLGAHTLPPEFREDRAGYLHLLCKTMLPEIAAAKLADAVDVFCEKIAFTPSETEQIFFAAIHHGLKVKLHADQLSDQDGAAIAAKYGALSADHLEHASEAGIAAMAKSGTVAVLLPCASYFLKEKKKPPVEALRRARVPIAIATDFNPGTAPCASPLLALNMACTMFGLSPEESLAGMTRNAARALGLSAEIGTLESGKNADLAVWDIESPAELSYWMGLNPLFDRYCEGVSDRFDGMGS